MPNLIEQRATALKSAKDIFDAAKGAARELTTDENTQIKGLLDSVDQLDVKIKAAREGEALMGRLTGLAPDQETPEPGKSAPKSLGEHFVKHVGEPALRLLKAGELKQVSSPEFVKAATDVNTVAGGQYGPVLTDIDPTLVTGFRRPVVSDILGATSITGNAITYPVEGAFEGSPGTVAELGQKPQIHVAGPAWTTDKLTKIAEWWDTSDEMVEDLPYYVSEINNRATYQLALKEEQQLLYGTGTAPDLLGITLRSGIQSVTQATGESAADAIFRAVTAVQTATGLPADGIVINPADYQSLRLAKDGNGQYYGGGFFAGQYNVGGIAFQPPVWGLTTVVSAAANAKTVLVGAFKPATAVFRKGGLRVESTNSDQGKFTSNVITTRIEERIGLQVKRPAAIVKVTLL